MKLDRLTFNKWIDWTKKIKSDLIQIINRQQIFINFIEIVNANLEHIKKNEGLIFCDFIRECYAAQAALGIRRHIKCDEDSISLMRLLVQIKKCSQQFTYDFYLKQYPIVEFEWQKQIFHNLSKNGIIISSEIIEDDIQKLFDIGGKVSNFADRVVAHLDKRGSTDKVTYADLEDALDLFNEITRKYIALITSDGYTILQPTIQCDWEKIFTVPIDIRKNFS